MIKRKTWIKWTLIIFGTLLVLSIASVLFINNELKKMYGGWTKQVAPTRFLAKEEALIAIEQVNLLSPNADTFFSNQTILIERGKITQMGDQISIPENCVRIDGRGKYLIPGLIDAHIHLWQSPNDFLLYLANGITSVRELKGSDHHLQWRDEIASGERLGPHLFVATTKFQSKGFFEGWFLHWTQGDVILNHPQKAKKVLQGLKNKGYQAIKIGSHLSKESYQAVSQASRELDIPLVGHLPLDMGLADLWTSQQSDVVHLEEFVKHINQEFGYVHHDNKEEFLAQVEKRGQEIARKLVDRGIYVTTTLWLTECFPQLKTRMQETLEYVQLQYANPGLVEGTVITSQALGWLPSVNPYRLPQDLSEKAKTNHLAYWNAYTKANQILLKIFSEKGVTLMAGTDANLPVLVPGFSLHDELVSMQRVGMTPRQVLNSATAIPAQWMKMNTGKIEKGYEADLLLLHENPLEDIKNAQSIETVILGGKILARDRLDEMLMAVEEANQQSRKVDISPYLKPKKE